jgi:hypothetical protein
LFIIIEVKMIQNKFFDASDPKMDLRSSEIQPHIGLGLCDEDRISPLSMPPFSQTKSTSHQILDIILEHALNKFHDSEDRLAAGTARFLLTIDHFVTTGRRVEACLPAFPFKSANKVYKVLGNLPDKAEELALQRLNVMCARIAELYKPGASVTIISDGITYNGNATIFSCRYGHNLTTSFRPIVDIGSRHLGLRRSSTEYGYRKKVQTSQIFSLERPTGGSTAGQLTGNQLCRQLHQFPAVAS